MRGVRERLHRLRRDDAGFSLMEATAAMAVAVIMFVVLAQSLSVTLRLAQENRLQQQATAVGIESVEFVRGLQFDEIRLNACPSTGSGGANVYVGNGNPPVESHCDNWESHIWSLEADVFGLDADEEIVGSEEFGLVDPSYVETVDDAEFTVYQYVTEVEPGLKRFVVEVEWVFNDRARVHHTSTVITQLRG